MATKNRFQILKETLHRLEFLIKNPRVNFIIMDDGSSDGTNNFINERYPEILLLKNKKSKGIHQVRNKLFDAVETRFAVSIDDDVSIVIPFEIKNIIQYFDSNPQCAVMAFRMYWGVDQPPSKSSSERPVPVKSFVAGGHAMRMSAWEKLPRLPEWFRFYGEEEFISMELFKHGYEVHYTPKFFVHHRVNIKSRKKDKDYITRSRRSLRSGWYLYFLFYPLKYIPHKFLYSLWMQLKLKACKGDLKALAAIILAIIDLGINSLRLLKNRKPLNNSLYNNYLKLPDAKLYWIPKISKTSEKE